MPTIKKINLNGVSYDLGGGLTEDVKQASLQIAEKVAYIDEHGQQYYDDLYDAFYDNTWNVTNTLSNASSSNAATTVAKGGSYYTIISANTGYTLEGATVSVTMGGANVTSAVYSNGTVNIPTVTGDVVITVVAVALTVVSISAVYTQSGTVYDTDSLDSLKADLVVTATFSDSSTEVVPSEDYTLTGTLEEGTSTITVEYGGQTATFSVVVVSDPYLSLKNGSHTFSDGTSVSVLDNHVTIILGTRSSYSIIALSDVGLNTSDGTSVDNINNKSDLFASFENDDVVTIGIHNVSTSGALKANSSSVEIAFNMRERNSSSTIANATSVYPVVSDYHMLATEEIMSTTFTALTEASCFYCFVGSAHTNGSVIEFDVSIKKWHINTIGDNLVPFSTLTTVSPGITITKNADGSISCNVGSGTYRMIEFERATNYLQSVLTAGKRYLWHIKFEKTNSGINAAVLPALRKVDASSAISSADLGIIWLYSNGEIYVEWVQTNEMAYPGLFLTKDVAASYSAKLSELWVKEVDV